MTSASDTAAPVQLEFDEHGRLKPLTTDQCMTVFTQWAANYPSARFVVVTLAPDGSDGDVLGWGLALPHYAFTHLPALNVSGRFSTAASLIAMLRLSMDARLIWVDPEPDYWPDDTED